MHTIVMMSSSNFSLACKEKHNIHYFSAPARKRKKMARKGRRKNGYFRFHVLRETRFGIFALNKASRPRVVMR